MKIKGVVVANFDTSAAVCAFTACYEATFFAYHRKHLSLGANIHTLHTKRALLLVMPHSKNAKSTYKRVKAAKWAYMAAKTIF